MPAASVAVHVTSVYPTANVLPLAGSHPTCAAVPSAALAVASYATAAPFTEVASASTYSGAFIAGSVVSRTVTVTTKSPHVVLPALSAAMQNTGVSPIGKRLPLAGSHETGTGLPAESRAVAT